MFLKRLKLTNYRKISSEKNIVEFISSKIVLNQDNNDRAIKNLRVLYIDDFEEIEDGIEKIFEKAYLFTNEIAIEDF